jgi:hypothetical protein
MFYLSLKKEKTLRNQLIFDCLAVSIHDTGFVHPSGVNPFFYVRAIFHYETHELPDAFVVKPIHRISSKGP